jgi:PAS domain S-box-containing protein/putative nucleotidyltransferase with HDIG domain
MEVGSRKILFFSIPVTLLIMAIVYYSFHTGREIAKRYSPLVDAAMEIKLEATTAHLWFEEAISGDRTLDIEEIWAHLDQSEWYAHAMLDGGENQEGTFLALNSPHLRLKIEETIRGLHYFRQIAQQRWNAQSTSGIGSALDQRFDQAFLEFILAADDVETTLQKVIINDLQTFNFMEQLLMGFILMLGIVIAGLLLRYNANINKNIRALHKQEENLRITLNSIGDAVIVTDTEGVVTYINPVAIKLTGWTSVQAIGAPLAKVFNIVHAHTLEPVNNPVKKVLETGLIVGLANHTMLIARDGSEYQIADSGSPIRNPAGEISGVVLVFRDVSEEYTLLTELQSSQALIKTLLNTVPDMIWLKDVKGVYLTCNSKFERMYGAQENEIVGKTDHDFIDKELADFFQENDKKALIAGEATVNEELLTFADDGHIELVETIKTPMTDNKGNLIGILGIARDVTSYKESLAQLKESESRLKEAQIYAKIGYWELLADQKTGIWSEQMYALFGLVQESKAGPETLCEVMNKGDFPTFSASVKACFSSGHEHHVEYRITRPSDGEERWIECRGKVIADSDGKAQKISGFIQDITDRKNAQQTLRQSEATIRNKLKVILEPDAKIDALELSDIIDAQALQSLMDDFYNLTGMLGAILDLHGNILVAVGWQDICTQFHRCHPETRKKCIESDTLLTHGVAHGTFKEYNCKNNMWEMVTPIVIGGKHIGNVFIGQFFYKDKVPDVELFRKQAKTYGFDEQAYLAALDRVPRFTRDEVANGMHFYTKLTDIISVSSLSAIKQSRLLSEREREEKILKKSFEGTIQSIAMAVEARDPYTAGHQVRVANIAVLIATEMGLQPMQIDGIRWGAMIHDIGKINIPAEILSKPTKLRELEYELIKEHAQVGYNIMKTVDFPWPIADIAHQHHERVDGSGYPQGLKGSEICIEARIVAVADVVEAIGSHRPYRAALGLQVAMDEIKSKRGTGFDATVVDACIKVSEAVKLVLNG